MIGNVLVVFGFLYIWIMGMVWRFSAAGHIASGDGLTYSHNWYKGPLV